MGEGIGKTERGEERKSMRERERMLCVCACVCVKIAHNLLCMQFSLSHNVFLLVRFG